MREQEKQYEAGETTVLDEEGILPAGEEPVFGAADLFALRRKKLENIKPYICAKFYYAAAEKINQEERALQSMLGFAKRKAAAQKRYAPPLDPRYFQLRPLTAHS